MLYTLRFFSSKCSLFHNANLFGSCIIHILYTECAEIKKKFSGAKWLSSLDNLLMAYIQGQKCSFILYIVTNCNIILFMTVCIDIYMLQLCVTGVEIKGLYMVEKCW